MNRNARRRAPLTASVRAPLGELWSISPADLLALPHGRRWRGVVVVAAWLAALMVSLASGLWMVNANLTAVPVVMTVRDWFALDFYITLYPPLVISTLLLFWLGFWWALVVAYVTTLALALYTGMSAQWALLFAFSDTVGLAFLAVAYRSTGGRFNWRSITSIAFFVAAAFVAALAGSTGSFIWSHTRSLPPVESLAVWEGWWLGGFLQTVLICGPLLFLFTPLVNGLKLSWFGSAILRERGASLMTGVLLVTVLLVCAFIVADAHLTALRLADDYARGATPEALLDLGQSALRHIAWISVILVVASGLGFLGLAIKWNRELQREVVVRTRLLDRNATRIRKIIDLVPHLIFAREASGKFVLVNRTAARFMGQRPEALLDASPEMLAESLPVLSSFDRQDSELSAASGGAEDRTVVVADAAGEERTLSTAQILFETEGPEQTAVLTVAVDVTEQEKAEARLKNLVEELADKNRELERFTYTVSHDLKSPLITIKGFAREIARQIASGKTEGIEQDLGRIEKATARMQKLLDGLLVLSRTGKLTGPKQSVDMNRLFAEVIEIMSVQISEAGAKVEVESELPEALGDPVRLFELAQNLLENAIKFRDPDRPPRILMGCVGQEDGNHYFVEDNGRGVGADERERIFAMFEQLDAPESGSGIGLSLARRIVEVHGGRIWVEDAREGPGTRFVFVLPSA